MIALASQFGTPLENISDGQKSAKLLQNVMALHVIAYIMSSSNNF
jgi:hypothetical protein